VRAVSWSTSQTLVYYVVALAAGFDCCRAVRRAGVHFHIGVTTSSSPAAIVAGRGRLTVSGDSLMCFLLSFQLAASADQHWLKWSVLGIDIDLG